MPNMKSIRLNTTEVKVDVAISDDVGDVTDDCAKSKK